MATSKSEHNCELSCMGRALWADANTIHRPHGRPSFRLIHFKVAQPQSVGRIYLAASKLVPTADCKLPARPLATGQAGATCATLFSDKSGHKFGRNFSRGKKCSHKQREREIIGVFQWAQECRSIDSDNGTIRECLCVCPVEFAQSSSVRMLRNS